MIITKSDFQLFRDSPLHLWAKKHGQYKEERSAFAKHLSEQGYKVESLAVQYLQSVHGADRVITQKTYQDGDFEARVDVLVRDMDDDSYSLFEIKSSTGEIDRESGKPKDHHLYDAAFQTIILEANLNLKNIFLVEINKEYVRDGELDLSQMFVITQIDKSVAYLKAEVKELRKRALLNCEQESPDKLEACVKPATCPCKGLCHPVLPEYSIYDISGLWTDKKKELRNKGILTIKEIPASFPLFAKQRVQVEVTKSGIPIIHRDMIRHELEKLVKPLYFLDYETYNPAIPMYDGYRPYQHMVFQYSLHILESQDQEIKHFDHVVTHGGDPGLEIAEEMKKHIGPVGSIITWNSSFEGGKNAQMAEMYPEHREFLLDLNERIYDLADSFKDNNMYVLPEFKGSWSIKNVLPAMVPELSYKDLPINKGDVAMRSWFKMAHGATGEEEKEKLKTDLLQYCELDTLAMVEIWRKLAELV